MATTIVDRRQTCEHMPVVQSRYAGQTFAYCSIECTQTVGANPKWDVGPD